tara:strand:- start:147 stop:485 length:339 start_codon:yes stop_codon:yes gene_type:complete
MSAITINLVIEQGTDFSANFTIKNSDSNPVNLLGFTAEAKLKTSYYTSSAATPFSVTFVDRSKGILGISLTDTVTTTLKPRRYVYDIVLTNASGVKTRFIEGIATVTPGVTL